MDPKRTFDDDYQRSQPLQQSARTGSPAYDDSTEELAKWYKVNVPDRVGFEYETFEEGLMANREEMSALEAICVRINTDFRLDIESATRMGVDELELQIAQAIEAIMNEVSNMFPRVPYEWLHAWITAYVNNAVEVQPELHVQDPKNEIVTNPRNVVPIKGREAERLGGGRKVTGEGDWPISASGQTPLWELIFILEIYGNESPSTFRSEQVLSSRCLQIGHFGGHAHEYLLTLFMDEFQAIVDESDRPLNLRKCHLTWSNNGKLVPINHQRDFETAILHMFQNRGTEYYLRFKLFVPEVPTKEAANTQRKQSRLDAPLPPPPLHMKAYRGTSEGRGSEIEGTDRGRSERESKLEPETASTSGPSRPPVAVAHRPIASSTSSGGSGRTREPSIPRKPVAGSAAAQARTGAIQQGPEIQAPVEQRSFAATGSVGPGDPQPADISRLSNTTTHTASVTPVYSKDDTDRHGRRSTDPRDRPSDAGGSGRQSGDRGRSSGENSGKRRESDLSKTGRPRTNSLQRATTGILNTLKRVVTGTGKEDLPQDSDPNFNKAAHEGVFAEKSRSIYVSGGEYGSIPGSQLESGEIDDGELEGGKPSPILLSSRQDPTGRLKDLLNEDILNQMVKPSFEINSRKVDWQTCCQMFRIDPTKTGLSERVHLAGLRKGLFQFQAFGVYWAMVASRNGGGGFIADSPGLGKTLSYLAMLVVERQLSILWAEVDESRRTRSRLHLPAAGQNRSSVCPSSREGWICCPCLEFGPTSRLPPKLGVRLALIPAPLMANWRSQWDQHIDTTNKKLDMKLLIAQAGAAGLATDMADYPANLNMLKAKPRIRFPDSPKLGQERFLVLATLQSLPVFLNNLKYTGEALLPTGRIDKYGIPSRYAYVLDSTRYQIAFGIVCADECHEPSTTKNRAEVLGQLPGNPYCWGLSGTPFDLTPRYMQDMLTSIELQQERFEVTESASRWAEGHLIYQDFTREKFDNLCVDFMLHLMPEKRNKPEKSLDRIIDELRTLLWALMIRRTPETEWFGHELVELKPSVHQDVVLTLDMNNYSLFNDIMPSINADAAAALRTLQQQWDRLPDKQRRGPRPEALSFNNNVNAKYRLRIFETCPGLIEMTRNADITLKNEDLRKFRGPSKEKQSPYYKNIRRLLESSPKLLWILHELKKLSVLATSEGKEVKIIILTNFNLIALICKHVIERFMPSKKGRVALIHEGLTTLEKDDMIEGFCDEMRTTDRSGLVQRKVEEDYQYLIGTMKQIGKGYQLTRASYVILMEPDLDFGKEVQAFRRINRIGQKEPCAWTFRLMVEGNELESAIVKRQQHQGKFHGTLIQPVDLPRFLKSVGYKGVHLKITEEKPLPPDPPKGADSRRSSQSSGGSPVSRTKRPNRPRENPLTKSETGAPPRPPVTRQATPRSGPPTPSRSRDPSPSMVPPKRPSPPTASIPIRRPVAPSTRSREPSPATGTIPRRAVGSASGSREPSPSTVTVPRRVVGSASRSRDPSPGTQPKPAPRTTTARTKPPVTATGRRRAPSPEKEPLAPKTLKRRNASGELRAASQKSESEAGASDD